MRKIHVLGAGLAGSEAAYQIAKAGLPVNLYEMKPERFSPAHVSQNFAELVCSNSLRSDQLENAVGLLKKELRLSHSLIMQSADLHKVPAGGALAVDRESFSSYITGVLTRHSLVRIERREIKSLAEFPPDDWLIVATGPLTSDALFADLKHCLGQDDLYFFDAIAPIVERESIDFDKVFFASRYDKGEREYINCPFTKQEYENFYSELINAKTAEVKDFDQEKLFQGCMPVESIARQGVDTLRFGPLKPVGLSNPKTGKMPYAVVQLRQDNEAGSMYNLVGFQTRLTWPEQKRVFRLIPGLENAEFERYGVMHRNTFINSPKHLKLGYQMKQNAKLFFAGQITGVEGYLESAASGFTAAKSLIAQYRGQEIDQSAPYLNARTMMGGLAHYVAESDSSDFQPSNANFGLLPELAAQEKSSLRKKYQILDKGRKGRRLLYSYRALSYYQNSESIQ